MLMLKRPLICAVLGLITFVAGSSSRARTWHVRPDGTGDVPYFEAALEQAAAGDTVLVAPGRYEIGSAVLHSGVVLTSEGDPMDAHITEYPGAAGGISCSLIYNCEISRLWFDGFVGGSRVGGGAVNIADCQNLVVRDCVFTNNDFAGVVIDCSFPGVSLRNNTFVNNVVALNAVSGGAVCVQNIFWDSVPNLSIAYLMAGNDFLNINDLPAILEPSNFSQDPQFCGAADFHLYTTSPCAPANSFNSALIGALPVNCSPTRVQESTWGRVKALYHH
jgi:Right handed beta helix region